MRADVFQRATRPSGKLFAFVVVAAVAGGCDDPSGSGGGASAESPYGARRAAMVERLRAHVSDQRVLDAMARIPRHEFVLEHLREQSYEEADLALDEGQSMYGPSRVAQIAALLDLDGSEKVLEVGTGSGYFAAVLAELAREVWSIEIKPSLAKAAEKRLHDLKARGIVDSTADVHLLVGDGAQGWPDAAPYDAIVVSVASAEVPEALREQLRPGGRLVLPVGKVVQRLWLITRSEDGQSYSTENYGFVRFDELLPGS